MCSLLLVAFGLIISTQRLHRALVRRLAGKIGDILLIQRKYEIHKHGGPAKKEKQSTAWTGLPLNPGDKLELVAMIERISSDTEPRSVVCLSCSQCIPTVSGAETVGEPDRPRWTAW